MDVTNKRKDEITRLIVQALNEFGYRASASLLQKESGLELESENVRNFREAIMSGKWAAARDYFERLTVRDESIKKKAFFLIEKQKCLELAEQGKLSEAFNELQKFSRAIPELPVDTSFCVMLLHPVNEIRKELGVASMEDARTLLLNELSSFVSADILIPKNRLVTLLDQAKTFQIQKQLCHNVLRDFSFYTDYEVDDSQIPQITTHIFEEHTDDVWHISYSHNGRYLVSASRDRTAVVYDVTATTVLHRLLGHDNEVAYAQWSPDDDYILTCSDDKKVILWNAHTGARVRVFQKHSEPVSCCRWLPDGQSFVTGSLDCSIIHWALDGTILHRWRDLNIYDMDITPDGKRLFVVGVKQGLSTEKHLSVYHMETRQCLKRITLEAKATSVCVSKDSKYALTNTEPQTVLLWDLEDYRIVQHYDGSQQGRCLIGSCFGGQDETFVLSGSKDEKIRIWHKATGKLLKTLSGHVKYVNYVAYNPKNPYQFASASDDKTVRIWEAPEYLRDKGLFDEAMEVEQ
ncbi:WD repeat protein [Schizosaccharomyces japonicus yFS275]|uniref:WD repeat protein n=1 Tax=Schizosaccharomyces japonicus (strain yFS275 / FY16936) TaxID=402676 RepID=B6JY12_SCHJY|nr:WD repeat protein [Schizosaccharomyces japonicus yFS275]EEB06430.1 WD repeat protein [Schizosaccharomyces japonicus yFS275]